MNERMLAAIKSKTLGPLENSFATQLIAESLIEATTNSWFEDDRYGDYLSVEGMVIKGQYSPLAITTDCRLHPVLWKQDYSRHVFFLEINNYYWQQLPNKP